ncbi:MAG TPA: hypothetical protein DCF49_03860 [Lachnospiraceae bacterium]|nr:hypothetical protein [Lachnospiraceae bacterium]
MAFYVCMALAVLVTILVIISYLSSDSFAIRWESPIHAVLAVALINTCILYIPWFLYSWQTEEGDFKNNLLILPFMIIRLMQTVSMDADYEAALDIANLAQRSGASVQFLRFYCIVLSYVSVLVPLSGILTVIGIFGNRIGYMFTTGILSRRRRFYIFNGVGERNLRLAESIYNRCKEKGNAGECAFLFCNVREAPGAQAQRVIREVRGWYSGDYPSMLLKTVRFVTGRKVNYFLLDEENRNFNDAVWILKTAETFCEGEEIFPYADHVQVHLLLDSDQLDNIMDTQKKFGIMFNSMNTSRLYAMDLFEKWPLFIGQEDGEARAEFLVIGRGIIAEKILTSAVWLGQMGSCSFRFSYIGDDADVLEDKLRMTYPALFDPELAGGERFDLFFEKVSEDSKLELQNRDILDVDYAVIAGASDEENVKIAMWLRTWLARRKEEGAAQPLIAVLVRDIRRAEQAEKLRIQESREPYDLHVFGAEARLFTAEKMLDEEKARSLEKIQVSYSLDGPSLNPSEKDLKGARKSLNQSIYNYRSTEASLLYAVNRLYDSGALREYLVRRDKGESAPAGDSSRAGRKAEVGNTLAAAPLNADYSAYKQSRLWREAVLEKKLLGSAKTMEEILSIYEEKTADRALLEELAKTEHRRWIAYMAVNGWIRMPIDRLRTWKEKHSGSNKDYLRMSHACIAGWDELETVAGIMTDNSDPDRNKRQDRNNVSRLKWFLS